MNFLFAGGILLFNLIVCGQMDFAAGRIIRYGTVALYYDKIFTELIQRCREPSAEPRS